MPFDEFKFNKSRFLICEGDDDKGFLETLIRERGLPDFQVCHSAECNGGVAGGKSGFQHFFDGLSAAITGFSAVKAILIVTDNDTAGSFKAICDILTNSHHKAPSGPSGVGSIHKKPVAILMVPRYGTIGDLEFLCLPAIHKKWPKASGCVESFLKCTGADKWSKRSSINKASARAATVGFNEEDPFMGIGNLFKHGILSTKNTCFDEVAKFLNDFDRMCGI